MMISIIITSVALIIGLVSIHYIGHDNPVEEISEEIIKEMTGLEIDLSFQSEELGLEKDDIQ